MEPQPGTRKEAHSSHTWKASLKQRFTWLQGALLLLLKPKSSQLQPLLLLVLLFFSLRHTLQISVFALSCISPLSQELWMCFPQLPPVFPSSQKWLPPRNLATPKLYWFLLLFSSLTNPKRISNPPTKHVLTCREYQLPQQTTRISPFCHVFSSEPRRISSP